MADVTLSSAVRNNLLSLQNTAALMGKTQERLATGQKVNSALDDPTAFFTASSLNSRASDLNRLLDSVSNATQTIKAADEGLSAITKLVESAQATARQALQKPTSTTVEATVTGATGGVDLNDGGALVLGATETATLTVNGSTLNVTDATDVDDVLNFLNGLTDVTATVGGAGNGAITITGENGQAIDVTVGGTNGADLTAAIGLDSADDATATVTPNAERAALETEFNALRAQIDQLAGDASFNGVNLLAGDDLTVIFNENNSSSLSISGVDFDSAGLGIDAAASGDFQSNASINSVLSDLGAAINTLRSQAATFGSNLSVVEVRQDFTKNLINTLETGAANLTLADTNEEGANLLALQTRQQLSSVALSLASQADQNVLRLF
jgi:flagellin